MKRTISLIGLFLIFYSIMLFSQTGEQLSIKDAIALALKNNPLILASQQQVEADHGRFWRGVSPPLPSVSVSYDYIPNGNPIGQFRERTIGISQSLDFPTSILFRGLQLSSKISVSEAEHASASLAIILRVKAAYYNALAKQKKMELAKEYLSIANDFARKADTRYNVGEATNLERLTANVQRTQAQNAYETSQNELKTSFAELYNVLGRGKQEEQKEILLTDSLQYQPITRTMEQLIGRAYTINPQLKAASEKVAVASFDRTLAWSSFLPSLNASYAYQTIGGNSNFYSVSLGLSLPLWFLFDQRGQIQEASANVRMAEHNLQTTNNFLTLDIQNAFLELKNNERQILLHQAEILPQALEVYRIARASYDAGDITYIEYLQARQILISSRDEYVEELARYCISLAKLENAVGGSLIQ